MFSDKPGLTLVTSHDIDTDFIALATNKPYKYDNVTQGIIDYHINKMLLHDIIMSIKLPFASSVVLCRKNNGKSEDYLKALRFAIDYRKLNAITQYPQYLIPVIDEIW